jgi:protein-tyrosine phosphatase
METKGIIVHCMGGIGRTGTFLGCVLKDLGFQADEVINYPGDKQAKRSFKGCSETEWQAEMIRRYLKCLEIY